MKAYSEDHLNLVLAKLKGENIDKNYILKSLNSLSETVLHTKNQLVYLMYYFNMVKRSEYSVCVGIYNLNFKKLGNQLYILDDPSLDYFVDELIKVGFNQHKIDLTIEAARITLEKG